MKKLFIALILFCFFIFQISAQTAVNSLELKSIPNQSLKRAVSVDHSGLNIGASFLLPVQELSDFSTSGIAVDINYLYTISPHIKIGLASGYGIVFGNDYEGWIFTLKGEDFQYIPVAVSTRYAPTDKVEFGADLGYAIELSDSFDGGFYYRPLIAFNVSNLIQLHFSYTGVSNSNSWVTWSTLNFGVMLNIF